MPSIRRIISVAAVFALAWGNRAFCGDIYDAAAGGDLERVKSLVKANPDLVSSEETNMPSEIYGDTPLVLAVEYDRTDVVEFLLANKADVNARDDRGTTPLCGAVGITNILQPLLAKGADVNAKDNHGRTPLQLVVAAQRRFSKYPELVKRYAGVANILRQHGGHE